MDAQQEHDLKIAQQPVKLEPGSHSRLKDLLAKKSASSAQPSRSTGFDPIASAMRDHPGLTREQAEKDARDLGF